MAANRILSLKELAAEIHQQAVIAGINLKRQRWNERGLPTDEDLPTMSFKKRLGMFKCHLQCDGDATSAYAFSKDEAYRKWEALTHYYELVQSGEIE